MEITDLPLFPLATVLYPDGILNLRIFEARYLDLVRECTREGKPFGVCAVLGSEPHDGAARNSEAAAIGTLARIIDFDAQSDGLLGIQAVGGERFRALRTRIAANGLIRADVEITPTPDKRPIAPEFGLLNSILGRLIEQAGDQLPQAMREPVDDADWLACRLAELLPLSLQERQILLEMDEPEQRLEELLQILPRFQKA
ncbi:MAG: LON peptidase substrate-binding domain-containing protein [Xanthomonadales bacterium]|nr:LON peptidase substrate-binding domain-containing protein [Xanthomonadales bacterium]